MMLTKHPKLEGHVVEAWIEPAYREEGRETRFRFVVDERDESVGAVTGRYTLVRNADLLAAVELEADRRNLTLEPVTGAYRGGRSLYKLNVPGLAYHVPGDASDIVPSLVIRNDYRGGGGIKIQSGFFRVVCTNGVVAGDVYFFANMRHVGDMDLECVIARAFEQTIETVTVNRLLAETLAARPGDAKLVEAIIADTAKRYHADLERAIRENQSALGDNLWAVTQAVAEIATHRMQNRQTYNMAADTWGEHQFRAIRAYVEV